MPHKPATKSVDGLDYAAKNGDTARHLYHLRRHVEHRRDALTQAAATTARRLQSIHTDLQTTSLELLTLDTRLDLWRRDYLRNVSQGVRARLGEAPPA